MQIDTRNMSLPSINHIGVVVKNVDNTVEFLSRILGIGGWDTFEYQATKEELIAGEPFKLKIASARVGQIFWELLQPIEGKSIWADFLDTNGEGLHHAAFSVSDWDDRFEYLKEQGAELLASARVPKFGGKRWAYFGMKYGGIIIELMDNYGF